MSLKTGVPIGLAFLIQGIIIVTVVAGEFIIRKVIIEWKGKVYGK